MKEFHRHSIRLKEYDYSQEGSYFITICIHERLHLLGNVVNGKMVLNDAGIMVERQWRELINRFVNINLGNYVIMPNHLHGIITIVGAPLVGAQNDGQLNKIANSYKGQPQGIAPTISNKKIGDIVGAFKSLTTNDYIYNVKNNYWQPFKFTLWQRNYYEHIIRNEKSYNEISDYIINNPENWQEDKLFN